VACWQQHVAFVVEQASGCCGDLDCDTVNIRTKYSRLIFHISFIFVECIVGLLFLWESCVIFVPLLYSGYCVVLVLTVFVALRLAHSGVLSVIFDIR